MRTACADHDQGLTWNSPQVDLSEAPPFTLADLKNAIPAHCYKKNTVRSVMYMVRDVAIVLGMAAAAYTVNSWCAGWLTPRGGGF